MDKRNESATIHQLEHANAILEAKFAAAKKATASLPLTAAAPVRLSGSAATTHPDHKPDYVHPRPNSPTKSSQK